MKTLDKNNEKIIRDYMNNLEKFIETHELDKELINDIDERIFEKVHSIENPTRADIKNILHEIGTPEEIFAEEILLANGNNQESQKTMWQKFKSSTDKIIFLGTFYELGKITSISPNILRILFLIILFFGFAVNSVGIVFAIFFYFIGFLLLRTGFFRFIFSLGIGIFFILLLIPSLMLFGIYLSDFHIENMYIFMNISLLFPIGMVIGIFSLIVLALYFLRYAFTKKAFGIGFLLTGIISFIVAISMGIVLIFITFSQFNKDKIIYENKEIIANVSNSDVVFDYYSLSSGFDERHYYGNFYNISLWSSYSYYPEIAMSEDDKIHIFVTKKHFGFLGGEDVIDIEGFDIDEQGLARIKISNSWKKFPAGMSIFNVNKILFPKNFKFHSVGSRDYIYKYLDNFTIPNRDKYTEEQKKQIAHACAQFIFNNEGNLECLIDEAGIEEIIAYHTKPTPLTDEEKINLHADILRKYHFSGKVIDKVSSTIDLCEQECNTDFLHERRIVIAIPKDDMSTIYITTQNDPIIYDKNMVKYYPSDSIGKTTGALKNFFEFEYTDIIRTYSSYDHE